MASTRTTTSTATGASNLIDSLHLAPSYTWSAATSWADISSSHFQHFKFKKASNISTVTATITARGGVTPYDYTGNLRFVINGSASSTASFGPTNYSETTSTLDVSGLTNGTTYDIHLEQYCQYANCTMGLADVVFTGR